MAGDVPEPDEREIAERWSRRFGLESEYLFMEKGAHMFRPDQAARPADPVSRAAAFPNAHLDDPASVRL